MKCPDINAEADSGLRRSGCYRASVQKLSENHVDDWIVARMGKGMGHRS